MLVPPFTRAFLKSPSSRGLSAIAELLVITGTVIMGTVYLNTAIDVCAWLVGELKPLVTGMCVNLGKILGTLGHITGKMVISWVPRGHLRLILTKKGHREASTPNKLLKGTCPEPPRPRTLRLWAQGCSRPTSHCIKWGMANLFFAFILAGLYYVIADTDINRFPNCSVLYVLH